MGKNKALKTLGKIIGNVVLHKMLAEHTNKPESISHLMNEENEYRAAAIISAKKFNWNEEDKEEIKNVALDFFKKQSVKKYPDVSFPKNHVKSFLNKEMKDLRL